MKFRCIAAAALASLAGQAFALSPAQVADASTVKMYVSGATALRNIIGGLFTQHCSTDLDVYYSAANTSFGGVAFNAAGDAHRVYACTMKADSPILPGKKVAFFKSDLGGSGQGVYPVYFGGAEGATRTFLSLGNCSTRAAAVPNYTCSTEQTQIPMGGVSDVEPGLFKGINVPGDDPNYPQDGLSADQLAALDSKPVFQLVAAVAVNKSLRDAMQAKQSLTVGSDAEADRPSISLPEATSYFTASLAAPAEGLGWQILVGADNAKAATRVNVCRRVNGSGTQAMANAFITQFPCNTAALAPATNDFSNPSRANLATNAGPDGDLFVFEGSTTGNVISCLGAAEDNAAYAIGHVSKENNELGTGSKWRHLKIDGIAPNRDNVKNGKYSYFFESTMQWHAAHVATLSQDQQDFLSQFRTTASQPDSLAKLATANQQGVAALPESYEGAFGTGTANEIAFGSRVSRGGNSCNPIIHYK
jgi:hypothetical protein